MEIGEEELNIVVQENILLRRDHDLNVTLLSVQHGDIVRCQISRGHDSSADQSMLPACNFPSQMNGEFC